MKQRRTKCGLASGRTALQAVLIPLMGEGTWLNDSGRVFARASQQWDPVAAAFASSGVAVRRSVTVGGRTVQLDLIEAAGANLATALATGTYTLATTAASVVWWDGATGDYTITTNGAGTISAKKTTADGRNYVTITGHAAGDTVTCTRAGSPTNTHLQVEQWPHPTSKIALSGTRAAATLKSTGLTTGDAGTMVLLVQPYGWSLDQGDSKTWVGYRQTTGATNTVWQVRQSATTMRASRFWSGGGGGSASRDLPTPFSDNVLRIVAQTWSLADACDSLPSGRSCHDYSDGGSTPVAVTAATTPIVVLTSLDIGCWIVGGGQQANAWVGVIKYDRVLTQDEIDALALGFESSAQPRISCWGDSTTAYNAGVSYPEKLLAQRAGNRLHNAGVGGKSSSDILGYLKAAPRKWGDITVIMAGANQTDPVQTPLDIAEMVRLLGHTRYIVCTPYNTSDEPLGSDAYNVKKAIWDWIIATFPSNYYDGRGYIIAHNLLADAADTANDVIGATYRVDHVHLTSAGNDLFVQGLLPVLAAVGG